MNSTPIPSLCVEPNGLLYNLMCRGFIVFANGETLSAGVWRNNACKDHKLTVGNDTVLFDISADIADGLTKGLKASFFMCPVDHIPLTITDRMRWLAEVNRLISEDSTFVSYIVGDDHVTVETGFEAGLPADYFRVHGLSEFWSLPPSDAAMLLSTAPSHAGG